MSPEQLLGQLETDGQVVVADFEAGLGTLSRMEPGNTDVLVVVAEPTQKSIQVAQRALALIRERDLGRVVLVANRAARVEDETMIRLAFPEMEAVVVPDDPAVRAADLAGRAPFDAAPQAPAVLALSRVADSLFLPA